MRRLSVSVASAAIGSVCQSAPSRVRTNNSVSFIGPDPQDQRFVRTEQRLRVLDGKRFRVCQRHEIGKFLLEAGADIGKLAADIGKCLPVCATPDASC